MLDTAAFHRLAKLGGVGRRGYDPEMVLTLFVYAMAHGVSSSRRMERLCETDVAFGYAGYDCDANLAADGPEPLIADGKRHTIAARAATDPTTGDPPEGASVREKMNHRLRTADGHAPYKRRSPLIETPNAWLKDGRGLRRFARRGLDAVHAELALASAVTNLLKITTKGVTATQLRTA